MNLNGNKYEESNVLPFNTCVFHEAYLARCIDFYIIYNICVKRLTSFVRTVHAASDAKICTIPNSDLFSSIYLQHPCRVRRCWVRFNLFVYIYFVNTPVLQLD